MDSLNHSTVGSVAKYEPVEKDQQIILLVQDWQRVDDVYTGWIKIPDINKLELEEKEKTLLLSSNFHFSLTEYPRGIGRGNISHINTKIYALVDKIVEKLQDNFEKGPIVADKNTRIIVVTNLVY